MSRRQPTPPPEIGPPTVLVGGMYHGEQRPTYIEADGEFAEQIMLPSIDGSCACDPADMVCGQVRFDQAYFLKTIDIPLPSGVICRYAYWCHETLVETIDEQTEIIPLDQCYVQRLSATEADELPGPFIDDGRGDVIGLN